MTTDDPTPSGPTQRTLVGEGDAALDQRLSDELDRHNAAATADVEPARELTVQVLDGDGALLAGASGWTWGAAAGIAMTWVDASVRGQGVGRDLLAAFEEEARARGCTHVFTTSFTFQAPDFYVAAGYRETFRWEGVPTAGRDDVHLRKDLC
ncbi:GNAT family N-acetyltransferase [Phycicoccus avicenniae]|uniref:GNAT family N-acetyltransferase n=1 Tax=Phycicoccus avicenniae TaxID=2828860 RepID=UPI00201192BF|nr:GNAT family N-acetyltransferase [Phycicoccus avicenniae]